MNIAIPVVTALVTTVVSVVALVLSKEQKISEFRQAWVDALRKDLSCFLALASNAGDNRKHLVTLYRRILLRLNPEKRSHWQLISDLKNLYNALPGQPTDITAHEEAITKDGQVILTGQCQVLPAFSGVCEERASPDAAPEA